jgi:pimeloyl-ACP methyl ester carboxylesterase
VEPCGLQTRQACAAAEPLALAEARRRLESEAIRGLCDTGLYRCPYYVWGTGPPLLFIPGLSDDALSFVLPMALLSQHFRCMAYDLPTGRGDGARLGRYCHEDLVADAFAVLDHLGVQRSYVFGSSFGSTIALAALRAAPERLPRAILQGAFAHRPLAPAELLVTCLARYWPGPMRQMPFRKTLLRHVHFGPFAPRPPDLWEYLLTRWGTAPMSAVARRALVLHQLDLRPVLPEIRQPVLLICGDSDPLVSKRCEDALMHSLPNVTRAVLERCGHVPFFTHAELLAELVRQFLTPPGHGSDAECG